MNLLVLVIAVGQLGLLVLPVSSVILTPPYFNLVANKRVTATATCGEGMSEPELYCKLTGSTATDRDSYANLIQGQYCDYCDPRDPKRNHHANNSIDGTEKWWQSPPLSRSLDFNLVNLTIDLGQDFHVAYIYIKMANSPRPGLWALEKSIDGGVTFQPWQYFADTPSDCFNTFGVEANKRISRDDDVICTTDYSKVLPVEGGEILLSLVNNRPNSKNFTHSDVLQNWTRATNVRLRLMRTKNLLGHLMAVAKQDPTVTRRYFYSIRDISIGGRCVCNGHAQYCDESDPENPNKLVCRCSHNTCGDQCQECCPGFVQKPWKQNRENQEFECEPCQCYGHSDECEYDPEIDAQKLSIDIHGNYNGGGRCLNCEHNTEGINCEKCKRGYYRPFDRPINVTEACQRCDCNNPHSTGNCAEGTGQCECKEQYDGPTCDRCAEGYTDYPLCRPCDCHPAGRADNTCIGKCSSCKFGYLGPYCNECVDRYYGFPNCTECKCDREGRFDLNCDKKTGQCICRPGYEGLNCEKCENGYYGDHMCHPCDCDSSGTTKEVCNKTTGQCICGPNFTGDRCNECAPGFYNFPSCLPCECSEDGSHNSSCTYLSVKQCFCKEGRGGPECQACAPGYFNFPKCDPCECDRAGSIGASCDPNTGKCKCKPNFVGDKCSECAPNLFNYPICEECRCHPDGVLPEFPGCSKELKFINGIICPCKEYVTGRQCDVCKDRYYGLGSNDEKGCTACECSRDGTLNELDICDQQTGQCHCKLFAASSSCSVCKAGSYNLKRNDLFGCEPCDCRAGASADNNCDVNTGECRCLANIVGKKCDQPAPNHFIPSLHQLKFEIENGYTPTNKKPVRYGFDESAFPEFSWKGYVHLSKNLGEVAQDVRVEKTGSYRMVLRYINKNANMTDLFIRIKQLNANADEQSTTMYLPPNQFPSFTTVTVNQVAVLTIELEKADYVFSFQGQKDKLFVDYFVLLPSDYYESSVLTEKVERPCEDYRNPELCIQYKYVSIDNYPYRGLYSVDSIDSSRLVDLDSIKEFNHTDKKPLLAAKLSSGESLSKIITVAPNVSNYALLLDFMNLRGDGSEVNVEITHLDSNRRQYGKVYLYKCNITTLCREVVLSNQVNEPLLIDAKESVKIQLTSSSRGADNNELLIYQASLVPKEKFNINLIKMSPYCIVREKNCLPLEFPQFKSHKIEMDTQSDDYNSRQDLYQNQKQAVYGYIPSKKVVYLNGFFHEAQIPVQVTKPEYGDQVILLVHYYQPNHPVVNVSVSLGKNARGSFQANYCPSMSGCRSIVTFENSGEIFNNQEFRQATFTLVENSQDIWLDYMLLAPASVVNPEVFDSAPVDSNADFLAKCASQHFDTIITDKSKFCEDAVFSLSTKYNNGAQACSCDPDGTRDGKASCEYFGGQCDCKDNVIGRECSKCKTGYYGFPNCRKCDCPSGNCDDITGKCICPPNVEEGNCDTCVDGTHGFHPIFGCEECNCELEGTVDRNPVCDKESGQCVCKPNMDGLRCDRCKAGYYNYPSCYECQCDRNGTTDQICDAVTAQCICKENVVGDQCNMCNYGTFNLEDRNPKGCSKCFCFGTTDRCISSPLYFRKINDMDPLGWTLTNAAGKLFVSPELKVMKNSEQSSELSLSWDPQVVTSAKLGEPVYWNAPKSYINLVDKVASYGGTIKYIIRTVVPESSAALSVIRPDLILVGQNMTLVHISIKQPADNELFENTIDLLESQFSHLSSGSSASREQLMIVLASLKEIRLRATYYNHLHSSDLVSFEMDEAVSIYEPNADESRPALSAERCGCPENYRGFSCESCAEGFYKVKSHGPGLFNCVPCNCNGHSSVCDQETGECLECQDNTEGKYCESCKKGHYSVDLGGGRNVCRLCPCPGPGEANNFADSCMFDANSNRVYHCSCLPGYTGQFCERCSPGYYGDPTVAGGKCLPCQCNNNIDLRDYGSCDQRTGACLKCLYNTTGRYCDKCLPEHFGNPLDKTCQRCDCDLCGTETCNVKTGECVCKRNVTGLRCSSCGENMFGFSSCNGCSECDCDPVGSTSAQCNFLNGQCSCKPGVTGRRCDQCQSDYWSFSDSGCLKCNCDKDGVVYGTNGYKCNNQTGDCTCIPGVKGKYCDECDDKWVLVRGKGCVECDQCVVTLLGDAEELEMKADAIEHGNKNSSLTFKAHNKLVKLEDDFSTLKSNIDPQAYENTQLLTIQRAIQNIQRTDLPGLNLMTTYPINDMVKNLKTLLSDAEDFNKDINELRVKLDALDKLIKELEREDYNKMKNITDEQLNQYEQIVDLIAQKNLNSSLTDYYTLLEKFHKANRTVQALIGTFKGQMESADSVKNKNAYIQKSLIELKHLIDKAKSLEKFQDKDISFKVYYENLEQIQNETNVLKDNSFATVKNIDSLIKDAQNSLTAAGSELANLNDKISDLKAIYKDHDKKIQDLRQKCTQAENRAHELMSISNSWKSKVAKSQEGIVAFEMAQAYVKIASTLKTANEKSVSVLKQYTSANENLDDLLKKSEQLKSTCSELADDAKEEIAKKFDAEVENENLNGLYTKLEKKTKELSKNLDKVDQWINRTYTSDQTLTYLKSQLDMQQVELKTNQDVADDLIRKIQSLDSLKNSLPKPEGVSGGLDGGSSGAGGGEKLLDSIEASMESLRKAGPAIDESINKLLQDNNFNSELDQIKNDIYDLKLLISSTRDIVNEIKVAVNFNDSTVVNLKPSADLQPSLSTTASLYLQTRDSYAPIAFIYNESNPSEYVSLYLQSGRPFFQFRLSQSTPPVTLMTDQPVNNGQWHRVDIERIGQRAKLSVTSEQSNRESEMQSAENAVVFNLDPNGAKIVLGQFPLQVIPNELKTIAAYNNQFRGAMDDIKLNGHSYGLWNYDMARNIKGEPKRSSLSNLDSQLTAEVSEKAVYFMDDSFLCLSNSPITIKRKVGLDVTLKFKTDSPNGLLWIWSNDEKQYIAIYLESGVINVQLSQSNDFKRSLFDRIPTAENSIKLNDNKFHTVHVKLTVQDVPYSQQKTSEYMQDLKIVAEERSDPENAVSLGEANHKCERRIIVRNGMQCVGGIPANIREGPFKDAQFNSFVGCIGSLLVPTYDFNPIDLSEALLKSDTKAANVAPKCPEAADQCSIKKSATPVHLSFDTSNYDRNELQETVGVGFVTSNPDGVLFYRVETRNDDNTNRLLLQLKDRRLVLTVYETVNGESSSYSLNSDRSKQYSDNQLHFAYVIVNETSVKLRVDDQLIAQYNSKASSEADNNSANQVISSSKLFVAGVPEAQRGSSVAQEAFSNFEGCITQLIYNDNQLKFDSAESRSPNGIAFSKCYKTPLRSALASLPAYKQLQQSSSINVNRFSQTFSKQKQLQQQQQQSLKNDECALNKQYDSSQLKSVGLRFGLSKRSRLEVHESYPLKITSVVSFKFRTLQQDGLMFYASDAQFFDFIAVWLQDGYVHYAFDCGTGFMHITSKRVYSDGRYHTVTVKRDKQNGLLVLADRSNTTVTETVEGVSGGAANALSVVEPYYFGSIPENERSQLPASQTDLIVTEPFIGCMSDFNIAYKPLRNKIQKVELMNCSNNHESGAFFTGHSLTSHASLASYLALRDVYEIDFEIKSRTKNGVVLYVGPKDIGIDSAVKDFILLELVDGELVYKTNMGGYENIIKYQPELARNELCNSSWIRVKLRKDDKGEMSLELKGVELANQFPAESLSTLALSSKPNTIYVGSLPLRSAYAEITQTNEPFIGCIRDMTIKKSGGESTAASLSRALLDMTLESGVLNYCPLK